MKILSCGAGMQSTALALMSAENVKKGIVYPEVPIYDAIIFCDLNCEPAWVVEQVSFIASVCKQFGIPFYKLESFIYEDHVKRIALGKYIKMPLWTIKDGKKGKLMRACTIDYKITAIQQFVKHNLLGYKKYQRLKAEDIGAHEMHIGFSLEEQARIFKSINPMFINKFPLVDMGFMRVDSYSYSLEKWKLETKASACCICPYHTNYFYKYLRDNYPNDYKVVLDFDRSLACKPKNGLVTSDLFISKSCKRIRELSDDNFNDAQTFVYNENQIWNGF